MVTRPMCDISELCISNGLGIRIELILPKVGRAILSKNTRVRIYLEEITLFSQEKWPQL
jgi:hypothetical protein